VIIWYLCCVFNSWSIIAGFSGNCIRQGATCILLQTKCNELWHTESVEVLEKSMRTKCPWPWILKLVLVNLFVTATEFYVWYLFDWCINTVSRSKVKKLDRIQDAEKSAASATHWCIRSDIDKSTVGQLISVRERFDVDNCSLQLQLDYLYALEQWASFITAVTSTVVDVVTVRKYA